MPEGESEDVEKAPYVSGDRNLVAARDINVNVTTGVDPVTHATVISQSERMKRALAKFGVDADSEDFEANIDRVLEEASQAKDSSFDSEELLGLGFASFHRGRNSRAEGYFRESLKMFEKSGDMHGKLL